MYSPVYLFLGFLSVSAMMNKDVRCGITTNNAQKAICAKTLDE